METESDGYGFENGPVPVVMPEVYKEDETEDRLCSLADELARVLCWITESDNFFRNGRKPGTQLGIAARCGVSRWTIARWKKKGLPICDREKMRSWLENRNATRQTLLRAYALIWVLRPELVGGLTAAQLAESLGVSKERFHHVVKAFTQKFHYPLTLRTSESRRRMSEARAKWWAERQVKLSGFPHPD